MGRAIVGEEEALVSTMDFETIKASKGGVDVEVFNEGNDENLKVEGDLHVKVAHACRAMVEAKKRGEPVTPLNLTYSTQSMSINIKGLHSRGFQILPFLLPFQFPWQLKPSFDSQPDFLTPIPSIFAPDFRLRD
ncbi:hypothetical protein E2542_SST23511 [Spatholobus suberectus]|nr:hypothetical protein E2542_SST23511 [Spatholobus suberectus]